LLVIRIRLLRRFLIGLIAVVLLAVLVNYIQSRRRRNAETRPEAQILSPQWLRSADTIEYTAHKDGVKTFTIQAQKLLETREGKQHLQGIEAHDFNPDGSIRNRVHSQTAVYDTAGKRVFFAGNVRLILGPDVTLTMESLHYDHETQTGYSDDRLQLVSPKVRGTAKGVICDFARKNLELKRDLDFLLQRPVTHADGSVRLEDWRLTAHHGYYLEAELAIRLEGAARLASASGTLAGERIDAFLTEDKRHLTRVICQGDALYQSMDQEESRTIQGERIEFSIGQQLKALEHIRVLERARFAIASAAGEQELSAAEIELAMDPAAGAPRSVSSRTDVRFEMKRDGQTTRIAGESLAADFAAAEKTLESMRVQGHASLTTGGGSAGADELQAEDIRITFRNQQGRSTPLELQAENAVRWRSPGRARTPRGKEQPARALTASSLRMQYAQTGEWLQSGSAAGGVTISAVPPSGEQDSQIQRLQSDRVEFDFYPESNQLQNLTGEGHARIFYQRASRPETGKPGEVLRTSSASFRARFRKEDGAAESVSQSGDFVYQDDTRTATSGNCDFSAANQLLVLRDKPSIRDADSSTTGEVVEYDLKQKMLAVRGSVRSILRSSGGKSEGLLTSTVNSSSPSMITAQEMRYWTDLDKIQYRGNLNLLSANSQLQADVLEIYNHGERVEGQGNVKHLILGFRGPNRQDAPTAVPAKAAGANATTKESNQALIRSSQLQYSRDANRIHYEGSVFLESAQVKIRSDALDAFLDPTGRTVDRGRASGNLIINQPGREIKGLTADYFLAEGKVVVAGNPAELRDSGKSTTYAPQLTFFTASDRISFGIR
jgi:LPS export ABC transporter protein LptC